jgi:hypothetical protein
MTLWGLVSCSFLVGFLRALANGPGLKPDFCVAFFRSLKAIASLTLRLRDAAVMAYMSSGWYEQRTGDSRFTHYARNDKPEKQRQSQNGKKQKGKGNSAAK